MRNGVVRLVLLVGILLAGTAIAVQADTWPVPVCYPNPCRAK